MTTTPLRKSGLPQAPDTHANDDEAERQIRRSVVSLDASVSMASCSTAEDNENIKMCLKLFSDNKFSKDNAWSLTIIDSFAKLISRHSKTLQNFQVAGSTLEASTKVYGLRVDSVHTDVMRMCSELTRQTARAMKSNTGDDDEAGGGGDADGSMAEGGNKENEGAQQPKAKKKRARKMVSTVTKSKESINAPLDTNPFTDPFFAKLNSVVGDVNSSSRLMQNILPTKMADLRLRMNYPFWDARESLNLNLDCEPEDLVVANEADLCTLHIQPIGPDNRLHELRSGYVITDAPAEDDEDDEEDDRGHLLDTEARAHEVSILDRSALDMQFDINADVEPIPTGDAFILDYDAKNIDGNDDFAEDDEQALEQCKGLMRKTIQIEDMRPVDASCSQLEYSYRPIDHVISQFWAGPAHWKFKRSMRPRSTMLGSETASTSSSLAKERSTGRRRKRYEQDSLDDVFSVNEELFQPYNPSRPLKGINSLKSSICKKWESKKLKLPTDFKLDRDRFEEFQYARWLTIRENRNVGGGMELAPSEEYNCDAGDDQLSCGIDMDDGQEMEAMDNDVAFPAGEHSGAPPGVGGDEAPSQLHNQTVDVISTEFKGAPDKVAKINIAYAKTAKVIDMKQLKYNCWRVINSYVTPEAPAATQQSSPSEDDPQLPLPPATQSAEEHKITFSKLYQKVPQLLSKSMSENVSKALAFYAVLHLANEKSLRLEGQEDLKDFVIMKAEQ